MESKKRADISVFPLAFPFMAGPGALTTLLLWFGPIPVTQHPVQFLVMFGCALVVLALCLLAMWVAGPLMRVIGVTGTNVANRLFGVVLGALAVQFVVDGLRASFSEVQRQRRHVAAQYRRAEGQVPHSMAQARAAFLEARRRAFFRPRHPVAAR